MNLTYVPIDRVEVIRGDVELVSVLENPLRRLTAPAFLLVQEQDRFTEPFYYVLEEDALDEVLRRAEAEGTTLASLTSEVVYAMLDLRADTSAERLEAFRPEPRRRAVVFDSAGALTGVWAARIPQQPVAPRARRRGGPDWLDYPASDFPEDALAVDPLFRRTPHIDVTEREPLRPGTLFVAHVYLDTEAPGAGETAEEVVIDLPDELEELEIEVMLAVSEHLELRSEATKTLTMHRDAERSPDLAFEVAVRQSATVGEEAVIVAFFTYNHRPCGRVERRIAIGAVALAPAPGVSATEAIPAPELAIDARARPADLTIDVVPIPENDSRQFLVTLRTTLLDDFSMAEPELWALPRVTGEWVTEVMDLFTRGSTPAALLAALKGAGVQLFEAAPSSFRKLFWQLIDQAAENPAKQLRTIFISSAEPHIPWELMTPRRDRPDGSLDRRGPLGVEFAVGRWVHEGHRAPKQFDPIADSYVVAPTYAVPLKNAAQEAEWVCARFNGEAVRPAEHARLDSMLAERPVGLLHFIAHGKTGGPAVQTLALENDALFEAIQVRGMAGLEDACRAKAPLVFLNACEVGRETPSLVGAGGFATEFIKAGARGVVAPLWSVKDSLAHEVAVAFYEAALAEPTKPFADILREIRSRSYVVGGGEDTYAAYCFYGDPLTALAP